MANPNIQGRRGTVAPDDMPDGMATRSPARALALPATDHPAPARCPQLAQLHTQRLPKAGRFAYPRG